MICLLLNALKDNMTSNEMNTLSRQSPSPITRTLNFEHLQTKPERIFQTRVEGRVNISTNKPVHAAKSVEVTDKGIALASLINPSQVNLEDPKTLHAIARNHIPKYLDLPSLMQLSSATKAWKETVKPYFQKLLHEETKQGVASLEKLKIKVKFTPFPLESLSTWIEDTNFLLFYRKIWIGIPQPKINPEKDVHENAQMLRRWMKDIPELAHIYKLNLGGIGLTALPKEICLFTELECLHLMNNQLRHLPDFIGKLTQLEELDLASNELTFLPNTIGDLNQLNLLNLSGNNLNSLPDSIGKLGSLNRLRLSCNFLTSLPNTLGNLTQLEELDLDSNELRSFPKCLEELTELKVLNMNDNYLNSLPESIRKLAKLNNLNLSFNNLTSFPDSIRELKLLMHLNLKGNHLPNSLKRFLNEAMYSLLISSNSDSSKVSVYWDD